jgi:hypothetical protein
VVAVSGKKQRRLLQIEHNLSAAEGMVFPLVCTHLSRLHLCQLLNRRHLVLAVTMLSKWVVLSKLRILPLQPPPHPIRAFRFANYVCHCTDRQARVGGKAILVRRDIDHYAVPVSGLRHLEATAIYLVLANRPVKIVAAYFSPTRPLIESDQNECLSGGLPVLMVGDLNAKHTDWNSRFITTRGALLCDNANRNACLIHGRDSPTTVPYQQNANPDVLDIVVVKDFVLPVDLTVCPALSSDHLPVLIDTTSRTSFRNLLDRQDFKRIDWVAYHSYLEGRLPGNPTINDEEAIDKCVEELCIANQEALAASAQRGRPRAATQPY